MTIVLLALVFTFLREARFVQGQAELAAIRTTLAAMRTALVISHLRSRVAGEPSDVANWQQNPFELLQPRPANYRGEMDTERMLEVGPGSWAFDPACRCVGYAPIDPQWLYSPSGAVTVWFRVSGTSGPRQLVALQAYTWQGQVLD